MLMMLKATGALIEVQASPLLWDPYERAVDGCRLAGEEKQESESFAKQELVFLSGEALPQCWLDPHYRDEQWGGHRYDPVAAASVAGPVTYYGA